MRAPPDSSLVEMSRVVPSMDDTKSRANEVIKRRIRAPFCKGVSAVFHRQWTHLVLVAKERGITKRGELLLGLTHECIQTSLHIGEFLADVVDQDLDTMSFI